MTGFPPASDTPGYPYSVQVALEMFVKSMTWYVLPAAPWANPSFRPRERVGQAGAAPATVGVAAPVAVAVPVAAPVAGVAGVAGVPAAALGDAAGVARTVIVLVGVAAGLPLLPHPAASAGTQVSAAPASIRRTTAPVDTRRGMVERGVIDWFFLPSGSVSRMTGMTSFARRRLAGSRMSVGRVFPAGNVTAVCLLIALFGVVPDVPLLIAANRDEMYQRPADPITVLRATQPRILGGRDELAGGTWLAVNEHGVLAGLTNQPTGERDPAKRSRGELPLAFAAYPDAKTAVTEVCARLDPAAYNPCWLLVGDRHALFSVDLSGRRRAEVEELAPGRYVLENAPLRQPSAKQQRVAGLVAALDDAGPAGAGPAGAGPAEGELDEAGRVEAGLAAVLRDHQPAAGPEPPRPGRRARPVELSAACVHTERYGTRSAMIVSVGRAGEPRVSVAAGPPCVTPLVDVTGMWASPAGQPA